jgi:predicted nucleotidyltransferase
VKNDEIINSFKLQDELNPKIWDNEDTLNKEVREKLLAVATEFIDFLGVPILVEDIIFTGSLANYNWSKYSDIDLHVVADFTQFSDDLLPLYQELFKVKKTLFNTDHDIKIFGYDVELYVQDSNEAHFSSGVYSVLNDEWDNKPKKENVKIDKNLIRQKSNQWMEIIDTALEAASDVTADDAREIIKKCRNKLKKYRTCGLEKEGEYSDENLVFKVLRRNGYIEKLMNFENDVVDKELSL